MLRLLRSARRLVHYFITLPQSCWSLAKAISSAIPGLRNATVKFPSMTTPPGPSQAQSGAPGNGRGKVPCMSAFAAGSRAASSAVRSAEDTAEEVEEDDGTADASATAPAVALPSIPAP